MILVFGGIKGGSGKTTLATNTTVMLSEKNKVLLVDADDQNSASDWAEHRENQGLDSPWTTIKLSGSSVRTQVKKMEKDYDYIVIDTGGRDTSSQRAALTIAHVLVAPFQPRSLDIWTIGKISTLVREVRDINPNLIAYAVINRADPKGSDNEEAKAIISESKDLQCMYPIIGQRKAFANAAALGLAVTETKRKDQKAVGEMRSFIVAIEKDLKREPF